MFVKQTCTVLVALVCLVAAVPLNSIQEAVPLATEVYRLPTTIWPESYNLTLRPYLLETDKDKRFTFDGEVLIEIKPNVNTKTIALHSKNLNYSLSEYWPKSSTTKTQITLSAPNNVTDIMTLNLSNDLIANTSYILHFVYKGSMDDDMHGFYRSSYEDSANVTKWLGSTQFQTHHARRAFPSFDEPKFRATFNVTIIRHKNFKTVSNTRPISTTLDGVYFTDTFMTTPKMSTYLLAFIVSEFNERTDGDFGVLARPNYYKQTEYSFEVGRKILGALGTYLGLPYYSLGNDKMHMAAIPDFSAGAMENWGLLTYRERALLYEDSASTLSSQQYIAAVVAHEQAHQWFGDLVTCDWWSYTWLNEGFARYFQYFGTAMVENNWEMEKQFVVDQVQSVMGMDSTNSTNPMSDEDTNTPADLSRMFNSISYNKGGSVIRMISHIMGEERFQISLQEYLREHKFTNTLPQDLLDALKANWPSETKDHADAIFTSFTTQVGYPLIMANLSSDGKSVEFSQKRFLLKDLEKANASLLYTVPITYTTSVEQNFINTTPKFILPSNSNPKINLLTKVDWVIANIQETGYYRVNYTEANWHAIHSALVKSNWSGIHELNRAQIVDDLLNMARANEISYDLALDVLEYLETETNYLPWTSAFNGFNFLAIRLGTDTAHFGNYIQQITSKAYNQLGFNEKSSDSALDIYLRTKILTWACRFRSQDCISKAKAQFNTLTTNTAENKVPKNIRSVIYCVGLREGDTAEFDVLYNRFKTEEVATEETLLQTSLGCVKKQNLIERVFNLVLSKEIRKQDMSSVLSTLYTENNENVSPVFQLVTEKHEELAEAMGGYSSVATVISNIAARFTTEDQHTELQNFNKQNGYKFGSSRSTLNTAEGNVKENLEWAKTKLGAFKTYLAKRNGSATSNAFTTLTLVCVALIAMFLR